MCPGILFPMMGHLGSWCSLCRTGTCLGCHKDNHILGPDPKISYHCSASNDPAVFAQWQRLRIEIRDVIITLNTAVIPPDGSERVFGIIRLDADACEVVHPYLVNFSIWIRAHAYEGTFIELQLIEWINCLLLCLNMTYMDLIKLSFQSGNLPEYVTGVDTSPAKQLFDVWYQGEDPNLHPYRGFGFDPLILGPLGGQVPLDLSNVLP